MALKEDQSFDHTYPELFWTDLEQRTVDVFFRDDDVDENEPALHRLLHLFLELEIPVNLEIIPGRLTDSAIALLRQFHNRRPDLFELNQHGWMHINHELEGRKSEFGAKRNFDQQLADIARGKLVLEQAFGGAFSPVFTPPWNRCTVETYRALDQLGYHALSGLCGEKPVTGYSFREISVTLDLFRWKGGASLKSADTIFSELTSQLNDLSTIGIMLHHKVMDEAAFALIRYLLEQLRRSDAIRFHTFKSLLSEMR